METKNLFESQKLSNERKYQRDVALGERDVAIGERDSARTERDSARVERDDDSLAQKQFIATISHDLRNPIAAIKMAIEIVRGGASDEMKEKMFALMARNADQAGELITLFLNAHKIKSGEKLPINPVKCDMVVILRKCLDALAPQNRLKVNIDFNLKSEVIGTWDDAAIERAMKNMIDNALKFSDHDSEVEIKVDQGPDVTNISVHNTGEIIPLQDQARIFENQYRLKSGDQAKKGWGLGLTLIKGIAESHGGKIEVISNKLEGTIFTIRLPNNYLL